jgi:hypothetical protein
MNISLFEHHQPALATSVKENLMAEIAFNILQRSVNVLMMN